MTHAKFHVGDTVYNKVDRKGSFEPSVCEKHTKLVISTVSISNHTIYYTCGFDGYVFEESELMSVDEYKASL